VIPYELARATVALIAQQPLGQAYLLAKGWEQAAPELFMPEGR